MLSGILELFEEEIMKKLHILIFERGDCDMAVNIYLSTYNHFLVLKKIN